MRKRNLYITFVILGLLIMPVRCLQGYAAESAETQAETYAETDYEPQAETADSEGSITICGSRTQGVHGKTFTAYQIFALTYCGGPDGDTGDDYAYCLNAAYGDFFGEKDAYAFLTGLSQEALDQTAAELGDYIRKRKLTGISGTENEELGTYQISGLDNGYYLIVETDTDSEGTRSRMMFTSVVREVSSGDSGSGISGSGDSGIGSASIDSGCRNVVITLKADTPTLTKAIYHDDEASWQVSGDNAIGDLVDYRITATIPDTYGYEDYTYRIHDSMDEGLTFDPTSMKIYLDEAGENILSAADYSVCWEDHSAWQTAESVITDGCDFEVILPMETLRTLYDDQVEQIYVVYQCTLNEKAVVAPDHNDNSARLEYSNNPYADTTSRTKQVTVYDYTFVLNASKTDGENGLLSGASFQLLYMDQPLSLIQTEDNVYYLLGTQEVTGVSGTVTDTIVTREDGRILIRGLNDARVYELTETQAPKGYRKCEDLSFTVSAEYDAVTHLLSQLAVRSDTVRVEADQLVATILDDRATYLPKTGGSVTVILYVLAGLTGLGGIVCLIRAGILSGHGRRAKSEKSKIIGN